MSAKRNFEVYSIGTREEAECVIEQSRAIIEQHGMVSASQVLDLIGFGFAANFADSQSGWTDLSKATVRHDADGYILDLPEATPLT